VLNERKKAQTSQHAAEQAKVEFFTAMQANDENSHGKITDRAKALRKVRGCRAV